MLSFLTPKISLYALGAVLTLVAVQQVRITLVRRDLAAAQESLRLCDDDRATLRLNTATLTDALANQNGKISALEARNRSLATRAAENAREAIQAGENRKAEASRVGTGPDAMNAWLRGVYQ